MNRPGKLRAINLQAWTFSACLKGWFSTSFTHTRTQTNTSTHAGTLSWTWWMSLLPFASHHHSVCSKERTRESTSYCSHLTSLYLYLILLILRSPQVLLSTFHIIYTWWALTDWFTPASINNPKLVSSIAVLYCDSTLASPWKDHSSQGLSCYCTF